MKIGISSFTYPWAVGVPGYPPPTPLTAFDLLERAKTLGVEAVQYGDNLPLHMLSGADWKRLRDEAATNQIGIQVGMRGLTTENLKTYIKLAWEARSPFLRVVIDDGRYEPSLDEIIGIIQAKLPALESADVMLAIENHDRFKGSDLRNIAANTSPKWVRFCLDTTNSFGAGESVHDVVMALGRVPVVNLHVKDFTIGRVAHRMGFFIEGCEPGQGMLHLESVLLMLADGHVSTGHGDKLNFLPNRQANLPALTLEQWPPFHNTIEQTIAIEAEWAERGVNWIKQTLNQLP